MKLITLLPYAADFHTSARKVVEMEKAGLDAVLVAEAYSFDAAAENLSMAQFLRRELRRLASTAGAAELLARADDRRERLVGGVARERFAAAVDSM